jgi:hypothetical protein
MAIHSEDVSLHILPPFHPQALGAG